MATGTGTSAASRLPAGRRTALEEERDLLLRSLDDLDAEHAAGDLDDADYEALRDSYTQRAAEVLRQLEGGPVPGGSSGRAAAGKSGAATAVATAPAGRSRLSRRMAVFGGLAVFAVIAGLALAQGLGERGVNDSLTGAVDPSSRTQVMECQSQGAGPEGDLLGAIKCFDQVLTVDPDNAEALAYRGWYLLLAAGSVQQGGPSDTVPTADVQALIDSGLDYLTRAVEADPTLPDPLAFRAVAYDRLGRSADACADVAALKALDPPPFFLQQTSALAERNGC
ncbi:MAG: hypothetical protein R2761_17175 [Acidimicrobiales bacterium]